MYSFSLNALLGAVTIITLIFTCGDLDEILHSPYGLPIIGIFYNATKSVPATIIMVLLLIMPLFASVIAVVATASRQLRAFSRDLGGRFATFTGHVSCKGSPTRGQTLTIFGIDSPKGPYPHQRNNDLLGRLFRAQPGQSRLAYCSQRLLLPEHRLLTRILRNCDWLHATRTPLRRNSS